MSNRAVSQARSTAIERKAKCLRLRRNAILIAVFLTGCVSSNAQQREASNPESEPRRWRFSLVEGSADVCPAYVSRLNQSEFSTYPICDRPEDDHVAGFEKLNRVPLSVEEVERLYDTAVGLIRRGDPDYFRRSREQRGLSPSRSDGPEFARENQSRVSRGDVPLFYRFDPEIDIDNDGVADDVVIWKQTGVTCGSLSARAGYSGPIFSETHLLILDANGDVDVQRTKELLGHPGGESVTYRDEQGREQTLDFSRLRFRTIGNSNGVFAYRGRYYYDTFYGSTGDFNNQRVGLSGITHVIAVLAHSDGETKLMCEIRWLDAEDILGLTEE